METKTAQTLSKVHHLEVARTATYWTHGNFNPQTHTVWFVCHGYGQLAEYFIKHFEHLPPDEHYVVAPEALSRFYLHDKDNRIGASWMTRHERVYEMNDYMRYLHQLYDLVWLNSPCQLDCTRVIFLGFSQGTNTVSRWVYHGAVKVSKLVLWAGNFAPDVPWNETPSILGGNPIEVVYGLQDELIPQMKFDSEIQQMQESSLPLRLHTFEGKHELNREIISKLAEM